MSATHLPDTALGLDPSRLDREGRPVIAVRALLLAERLDTRTLERDGTLATAPVAITFGGDGLAIVFRYGAIVLFGGSPEARDSFLLGLDPLLLDKFATPEREELRLLVDADADQFVDTAGNILLRDRSVERLQLVADVLGKNLVLSHYEKRVAAIFDTIEPLAAALCDTGRGGVPGKQELLQHIGNVLLMQQKMVGRVETGEKPELVWEHPGLDRLYMRLAEEYELRERGRAIDRKLEVVSRTVETLLSLEQTRSSVRLEWYIIILIVAEVILAVYSLLSGH